MIKRFQFNDSQTGRVDSYHAKDLAEALRFLTRELGRKPKNVREIGTVYFYD